MHRGAEGALERPKTRSVGKALCKESDMDIGTSVVIATT
jgi:hypothetical protein